MVKSNSFLILEARSRGLLRFVCGESEALYTLYALGYTVGNKTLGISGCGDLSLICLFRTIL